MPPADRERLRGSLHKPSAQASALNTSRWRLLTVEIDQHVELKWCSYDGVYLTGFSVIY